MRKSLCALAAACLAGSALAGCGATEKRPSVPAALTDQQLIETAASGVVAIRAKLADGKVNGTGIQIAADKVLTAAHVVEGAASIKVAKNGHIVPARIVGRNACSDMAVLQLQDAMPSAVVLPLAPTGTLAPNARLDLLHYGVTIQRFGRQSMSTIPMTVSNPNVRRLDLPPDMPAFSRLLETTPDGPGGASGGPTLSANGEVAGMFVLGTGQQGYAIPADLLRQELPALLGGDQHGALGLQVAGFDQVDLGEVYQSPRLGQLVSDIVHRLDLAGLIVESTEDGGPADRARLFPGDVIAKVKGVRVRSMSDMCGVLQSATPGSRVSVAGITVDRDSEDFLTQWKVQVRVPR